MRIVNLLVTAFVQAESSSNLSSTAAEEPERKRRRSGEAREEAEHCSQCRVSLSTRKIRLDSAY
jgi:hypothetical protein